MDKTQTRLEILRLVHRFDRHPKDCITDAKIYEEYIFSSAPMLEAEVPKVAGNPKGPDANLKARYPASR